MVDATDIDIFQKQLAIQELTSEMRKHKQVDCPIIHEFADGVYSRKMFAPKGALIVGKKHRFRTYNILLSGEVSVYAGEGFPAQRIKAPHTFTSDAGVQKILYFHEDSEFINIHPTEETDLEKIEAHFIVPESEYALDFVEVGAVTNNTKGDA